MSDQELAGESTASTGNSPIAQSTTATNGLTVAALVLGILSVILIPVVEELSLAFQHWSLDTGVVARYTTMVDAGTGKD